MADSDLRPTISKNMSFDPNVDWAPESVIPIWPDVRAIDVRRTLLTYDAGADTLFFHLYDPIRPTVAIESGASRYLLVDINTDEVAGWMFEDVFAAGDLSSELLELLTYAELRGITRDAIVEKIDSAMQRRIKMIRFYLPRPKSNRWGHYRKNVLGMFPGSPPWTAPVPSW
jgi:hypothetical protein